MNISIINKVNEIMTKAHCNPNYHIVFTNGKGINYYSKDKIRISEYEIKGILDRISIDMLRLATGLVEFLIYKEIGVVTGNIYYRVYVSNRGCTLYDNIWNSNYNDIKNINEDTKKILASMYINDDKNYNLLDKDIIIGGITRLMRCHPSLEYKNVANDIIKANIGVVQDRILFDSIIYYYMILDKQLKPLLRRIFRGINIDVDLNNITVYSNTSKERLSAMLGKGSNYEGLNIHNIDMMINLLKVMPKEILTVPYKKESDIIEGIIFNFRDYHIDIAFLTRSADRNSEYAIKYKSGAIFNSDYIVENVRAYINKTAINNYNISICVPVI